jgi:hypothetical protein
LTSAAGKHFPQAYPQLAPRFPGISHDSPMEACGFSPPAANQFITKDFLPDMCALNKT